MCTKVRQVGAGIHRGTQGSLVVGVSPRVEQGYQEHQKGAPGSLLE